MGLWIDPSRATGCKRVIQGSASLGGPSLTPHRRGRQRGDPLSDPSVSAAYCPGKILMSLKRVLLSPPQKSALDYKVPFL